MKIEIYFLNSKLTTEIKKDIQVKDLLYDLKQYLNTTDSNFILFDNNYIQLKDSDTISTKKEKQLLFYLIKSPQNKINLINEEKKEKSKENLNASQLIKECTGAKKPLDLKLKIPFNTNSRFGIFELFDNRNNNPPQEENPFDRLLFFLQNLEENNQLGIRIEPVNNNAPPVEADEKSLRELQEMGFPEDRARQALINSRNDINRATEFLLGEVGE